MGCPPFHREAFRPGKRPEHRFSGIQHLRPAESVQLNTSHGSVSKALRTVGSLKHRVVDASAAKEEANPLVSHGPQWAFVTQE